MPVWGYADVVASNCAGLAAGERLFGYMPMATHLIIQPRKITPYGLADGAPHRAKLASIYNRYVRVNRSRRDTSHEDRHMIFYPLFVTSFLMQDFFTEHDYFGARNIVVSSASSKTAMGFAHLLARTGAPRPRITGLTAKTNRKFVSDLDDYDDVVAYEDLNDIASQEPTVFVDIAGNADIRKAVHRHIGENIVYSCAIGTSHWDKFERTGKLPGAKPLFFFAPDQAAKRRRDWGAPVFEARIQDRMDEWLRTMEWLQIRSGHGLDNAQRMYLEVLEGQVQPNQGLIVFLA